MAQHCEGCFDPNEVNGPNFRLYPRCLVFVGAFIHFCQKVHHLCFLLFQFSIFIYGLSANAFEEVAKTVEGEKEDKANIVPVLYIIFHKSDVITRGGLACVRESVERSQWYCS